jgi:hypothetical protein
VLVPMGLPPIVHQQAQLQPQPYRVRMRVRGGSSLVGVCERDYCLNITARAAAAPVGGVGGEGDNYSDMTAAIWSHFVLSRANQNENQAGNGRGRGHGGSRHTAAAAAAVVAAGQGGIATVAPTGRGAWGLAYHTRDLYGAPPVYHKTSTCTECGRPFG